MWRCDLELISSCSEYNTWRASECAVMKLLVSCRAENFFGYAVDIDCAQCGSWFTFRPWYHLPRYVIFFALLGLWRGSTGSSRAMCAYFSVLLYEVCHPAIVRSPFKVMSVLLATGIIIVITILCYYYYYYYYYYYCCLLSQAFSPVLLLSGPGSSVGMATCWTVRDRIPVGARFSAPVHTGPEAHPASCTMGTGSFLGVESGRGVTLTPYPF
jgi:hypothetical protein